MTRKNRPTAPDSSRRDGRALRPTRAPQRCGARPRAGVPRERHPGRGGPSRRRRPQRVVRGICNPVLAIAEMLGNTARWCRHHGEPGRHGLEDDEAERLGERGEDERLGAGVQGGEFTLTLEEAQEDGSGRLAAARSRCSSGPAPAMTRRVVPGGSCASARRYASINTPTPFSAARRPTYRKVNAPSTPSLTRSSLERCDG